MGKNKKKSNIPENEKDIDTFLEQVHLVRQSKYLQNPKDQKVKLSWRKGEELKITSTPSPEREVIESFLMRMRPLIVYEEPLYIGKIVTYLIEHSNNQKEKDALRKFYSVIDIHRNKRLFSIKVDGKEYGMPDFVWLYLYGKYFHIDKEKKKIIQEFENVLGALTEVSALSQVEGYAGLAMFLAGYIIRKRRGEKNLSKG